MIQVVEGLGWPEESPSASPELPYQYFAGMADGETYRTEEIVAELEALREEVAPEWSPRRGAYNMAILVARGLRLRR